jgi:hypothetical protein
LEEIVAFNEKPKKVSKGCLEAYKAAAEPVDLEELKMDDDEEMADVDEDEVEDEGEEDDDAALEDVKDLYDEDDTSGKKRKRADDDEEEAAGKKKKVFPRQRFDAEIGRCSSTGEKTQGKG